MHNNRTKIVKNSIRFQTKPRLNEYKKNLQSGVNTPSFVDEIKVSEAKVAQRDDLNDISQKTKDRIIKDGIMVSIIGASIRPQYWISFYRNIKDNNITPFEVVFCGDATFDFELPENFTYIYSQVKPSQCIEIARRAAWGKFVFFVSDDIVFNKHCVDNLVETYLEKCNNKYDIVSTQYHFRYASIDVKNKFSVVQLFWPKSKMIKDNHIIQDMPYFPIGIFTLSSSMDEIGGIDRSFIAQAFEMDLTMRMYERGGRLYYNSHSFIMKEYKSKTSLDKSNEYGWKGEIQKVYDAWCTKVDLDSQIDSKLFYTSVCDNKVISKRRLKPAIPFEYKDLLIRSQGPAGRWV